MSTPARRHAVLLLAAPCSLALRGRLALLLALALAPISAVAQEEPASLVTVTLKIVDRSAGRPLDDVVVLIPELSIHLVSDANGHAVLQEIAVGSFEMLLTRLGFEDVRGRFTVDRGGLLQIDMDRILVSEAAEPGSVRGRVLAPETGEVISGASVSIVGTSLRRLTNEDGTFQMAEVPPGWQTVSVEYLGRATVRDSVFVTRRRVVSVQVELPVSAIELGGITVSTYPRWLVRSGFLNRQKAIGAFSGRQWTQDMIAERDPFTLEAVVKELTGIRREGPISYYGRRHCKLAIYVNDFLMDEFFDLDMIEPRRVEALEVYHGRPIPIEYEIQGRCGVILIWMMR